MEFSTEGFQKKIAKPWGEELIFTPDDLGRAGKIIKVNQGMKLSFQYHDIKEETLCLLSGQALLWLENKNHEIEKIDMQPNHGYTVVPAQKHRIEALRDCVIVEVSSPETGTTVRIDDDYKRADETEDMRNQPNRGWRE